MPLALSSFDDEFLVLKRERMLRGGNGNGLDPLRLQQQRQLFAHFVGQRRCREPDVTGLHPAQYHRRGGVADHGEFVAFQNAGNRDMVRRAPGSEQQVYLILDDQLLVDLGSLSGIGLVVVHHEFDRALGAGDIETAARVDLIAPKLIRVLLRWRRRCKNSGERQRKTDPHWIGCRGTTRAREREAQTCYGYRQCPDHVGSPCKATQIEIGPVARNIGWRDATSTLQLHRLNVL